MTEPIYEYVKGKGWIIPEYPIVTMQCGTVVRLEPRAPGIGETWLRVNTPSTWLNPDGSPIWEEFIKVLRHDYNSYRQLSGWRQVSPAFIREREEYEREYPGRRYYITVIRVVS